jgi:predicted ester cyclase
MSSTLHPTTVPAYGVDNEIVDYILGITFDIWERRQVDDILDYYHEDVVVYGLDKIFHGASTMVTQTHATLKAFPDRLLFGDDVICSGNTTRGYSSHRVVSPMTNMGETTYGPATGRRVHAMNIADCEVIDGLITREWLVRDNLALLSQLGFDANSAAKNAAERLDSATAQWIQDEFERVSNSPAEPGNDCTENEPWSAEAFARQVLKNCWISGDRAQMEQNYAPYCVLHRAPVRISSGREAIMEHYADWRKTLPDASLSVDHVCSQPFGPSGMNIAVRWGVAGLQEGTFAGIGASGQPVYILGVTHWRLIGGRIVSEWTVFDEIAIAAQSLSQQG